MPRPSSLSGLKIDDQIKLEPEDMRTDNEIRLPLPLRNPTQGGHGFRRKADSIPMIADSL